MIMRKEKVFILRKVFDSNGIMRRIALMMALVLATALFYTNNIDSSADGIPEIVSFDGIYTYEQMLADAQELNMYYPDVVSYELRAQTALGRQILVLKLGNPSAPRQILVHASIHGREYYVTPLVMKMAEYYAANEKELLATTCFTIVPMANPDGVAIAQSGVMAAPDANYQAFLGFIGHFGAWKSNANGVDVNRNFPVGWGLAETRMMSNSYAYYEGMAPSSEVETMVLEQLLAENSFDCYLAYHMRGNLIYFYAPTCSPEMFAMSQLIATTVHNSTGYGIDVDLTDTHPNGSFADYAQITCGVPGCTIECGTTLPPAGSDQVAGFYSRNFSSWKNVANLFAGEDMN